MIHRYVNILNIWAYIDIIYVVYTYDHGVCIYIYVCGCVCIYKVSYSYDTAAINWYFGGNQYTMV